jgi:hypothetical protein
VSEKYGTGMKIGIKAYGILQLIFIDKNQTNPGIFQ